MSEPTYEPAATASDQLLAALADEFAARLRRGERPTVEEYVAKHPQLEETIRKAFSAIAMIEESRTANPAASGEHLGAMIGRYKLLERIGEGGFGVVYMAEQQYPVRRKVALKVIKPGMDSRQVLARFEAERQALAIMDHPHIAKVLDAGATDSGRPYFVMELVKGEPITEYCDHNQLEPRQRLELFVQVCEAVQHAHQKGIIHRDLKPSNVLVAMHDTTPVVKVIDFGVAKALGQELTEHTLFTGFAQLLGTPLYMSPEQAGHSALDVDTRSDIYSLGVLLYELLTGTTPFDKERFKQAAEDEIRRIIREEEPPRPSTRLSSLGESAVEIAKRRQTPLTTLERELGGELEWIPLKALRKDRSQRYATAHEMAEDIANYLEHRPLSAGPESARYRARKFLRRNKGPVAAVAAVFLTLVCGIVGTALGLRQAVRAGNAQRAARQLADEAALDARREAEKQRAINDFINELFASANPQALTADAKVKGKDVTVLSVMDEAARQLSLGSLSNRPEIEAAVRRTIGNVYRDLGEYAKAEPQLQASLDLFKRVYGPNHREVAQSLSDLATLRARQGKRAEAQSLFEQAMDLQQKALGPRSADVATSLYNLAGIYKQRGRDCRPLLQQALQIRQETLEPDHPDLALSLRAVAREGFAITPATPDPTDALAEREKMCRSALAIQERKLGHAHPETAMTMYALARIVTQRDRDEARKLYGDTVNLLKEILPPDHPDVAEVLIWAAATENAMDNFPAAEKMHAEALGIQLKKQLGNPIVGRTFDLLGQAIERQGRLDDAETTYRRGVDYRLEWMPDHSATRDAVIEFQSFLLRHGKIAESEAFARDWLHQVRKRPDVKPTQVHGALLAVGLSLQNQGRLRAAEKFYRELLEFDLTTLGDKLVHANGSIDHLSTLLQEQGRLLDAEREMRRVIQVMENATPEKPSVFAGSVRTKLGRLIEQRGLTREAEQAFLPVGPIQQKNADQVTAHWMLSSNTDDLGRVLREQLRPAEAERLYKERLPKLREYFGETSPDVTKIKRLLVPTLLVQGKTEEAQASADEFFAMVRAWRLTGNIESVFETNRLAESLLEISDRVDTGSLLDRCDREARAAAEVFRRKQTIVATDALTCAADVLAALGKSADAEMIFDEALHLRWKIEARENTPGGYEPSELFFHLGLTGKRTETIALARELLRVQRERPRPEQNPNILYGMNRLARALFEAGDYAEALTLATEALEKQSATLGRTSLTTTLYTMETVAWLREATGDHEEARKLFAELLREATTNLGPAHLLTFRAGVSLACVYDDLARHADAQALLERTFSDADAARGPDDLLIAGQLTNLAYELLRLRKHEQAVPLLLHAVNIRKNRIPDEWRRYNAESMLGEALAGAGRRDEAEAHLLAGYEGLEKQRKRRPESAEFRLREARQRLANYYRSLGAPTQAAQWEAKLATSPAEGQSRPTSRQSRPTDSTN